MTDGLMVTTSHGFRARSAAHSDDSIVTNITGWFERGGVRQDRASRPWGDGDFTAPTFREAKLVAIEGACITDSGFSQIRSLEMLEAQLGNGAQTRLVVQSAAGATWAEAQLDSAPTVKNDRYGVLLSYRAMMYVRDGYRYGPVNTSASGEAAFHRGTAAATPAFTVTGSMPSGYSITSPYGTFTVTQGLSAGQTHRISFADGGLVYRNGALQRGVYAHPRNMWTIPAGATPVHTLVPVSGSGSLTVQVPDTY